MAWMRITLIMFRMLFALPIFFATMASNQRSEPP
jgi:hypothetical protein